MHKNVWALGLLLMAAMFALTSCSDDGRVGLRVSGHWFGDMDMWIGEEKARGSEIEFTPTGWGYTHGKGVEVDYYRYGTMTHYFNYEVVDRIIYMTFDDPLLDCAIVDYSISTYRFNGFIADYHTLENLTHFSLRNYDSDWNQYGYGGYYYDPYYVKGEMADSLATDSIMAQPKCVRGVNRPKVKREGWK